MTRRHALAVATSLALTFGLAQAEDFDGVRADTLLDDLDFFRLATCGAAPGGTCRSPTVRWSQPSLRVALLPGTSAAEAATGQRISPALDAAIATINRVNAGVTLTRVTEDDADIRIRTVDVREGTQMQDVPGTSAPGVMGVGYVTLWWNGADQITDASILFSTDITTADLSSVVLEELFQSLGPRFDIEGTGYEGVSILSQTSNVTTTIADQDAELLRWLYPPKDH